VVDAFTSANPAVSRHYFLSHFHSDHYGGLTRGFAAGTIYCSAVTAALVALKLHVDASRLRVLPMDTPTVVEGVTVRFVWGCSLLVAMHHH